MCAPRVPPAADRLPARPAPHSRGGARPSAVSPIPPSSYRRRGAAAPRGKGRAAAPHLHTARGAPAGGEGRVPCGRARGESRARSVGGQPSPLAAAGCGDCVCAMGAWCVTP
eukprot:gene4618-6550_t